MCNVESWTCPIGRSKQDELRDLREPEPAPGKKTSHHCQSRPPPMARRRVDPPCLSTHRWFSRPSTGHAVVEVNLQEIQQPQSQSKDPTGSSPLGVKLLEVLKKTVMVVARGESDGTLCSHHPDTRTAMGLLPQTGQTPGLIGKYHQIPYMECLGDIQYESLFMVQTCGELRYVEVTDLMLQRVTSNEEHHIHMQCFPGVEVLALWGDFGRHGPRAHPTKWKTRLCFVDGAMYVLCWTWVHLSRMSSRSSRFSRRSIYATTISLHARPAHVARPNTQTHQPEARDEVHL